MKTCSVDGCDRAVRARGLCSKHYHLEWTAMHRGKVSVYARRHRAKDPKNHVSRVAAWRAANPEKARAHYTTARAKNRKKVYLYNAARRTLRVKQQCSCCTSVDFAAVYEWARAMALEVDHGIPLAVGGPHCVKNLQSLTAEEHKAKTKRDLILIGEFKRAKRQKELTL